MSTYLSVSHRDCRVSTPTLAAVVEVIVVRRPYLLHDHGEGDSMKTGWTSYASGLDTSTSLW
ncbi:MAG: hypothetical protein ACYCVN_12650 [Acidimicrobiales bacterium]